MVVGFNVRPSAEVRAVAERAGIEIRLYRVIYQLTEEIEQALVGMLTPVETEAIIGEVEVRALFKVSRLGTIAGCMVTSGLVRRGSSVRLFRDGTRIHETTVAALKRFKDDVREVTEGFECGILLEGFNDLREGDVFEVFETREVERTSLDERRGRRRAPRSALASGFVAILTVELHFPEAASLKGKRHFVRSAKDNLRNRFGAVGRRGRPPRSLAAGDADRRLRRARRPRGRGAGRRRRALARLGRLGARPLRPPARLPDD